MRQLFKHGTPCAIDVQTTGKDFVNDELIEIAIVPLTSDLKPDENLKVFNVSIVPAYPDKIDIKNVRMLRAKFYKINIEGFGREQAIDLFENWCDDLGFMNTKQIIPIGHHYGFAHKFIEKWLTHEIYNFYFNSFYHDTKRTACYMNMRKWYFLEKAEFTPPTLQIICDYFKIPYPSSKKYLLANAVAISKAYCSLLEHAF